MKGKKKKKALLTFIFKNFKWNSTLTCRLCLHCHDRGCLDTVCLVHSSPQERKKNKRDVMLWMEMSRKSNSRP